MAVHQGSQESGDLVFFSRNGLFPTHVGIVKDRDHYIHAPGSTGTRVVEAAIKPEPITLKNDGQRMLYVQNPIGFKSPTIALPDPTYGYHQQPLV